MTGLRSAIAFLTILPVAPRRLEEGLTLARGWFPTVGLLLGIALGVLDLVMRWGHSTLSAGVVPSDQEAAPPVLLSAILVVALVAATRILHLDGLMDTCDALFGGFDREQRLKILRDPHVGAFAVVSVVCLLAIKIAAVAALAGPSRLWVIILFPCLSRWAMLLAMELFPYLRSDGIGLPLLRRGG